VNTAALLVPASGGWRVRVLADADDGPASLPANSSDRLVAPDDLAGTVAALEQELSPRWVWPDTATVYPGLLAAGVRVGRCHDLRLTEGLLVAHDGHWGEPAGLAAAAARLVPGSEIPPDVPPGPAHAQPTLFEDEPGAGPALEPGTVLGVLAAQRRRTAEARRGSPGFGLLVAAESVAALAAAEIGAAGLPWRGDVHDELLAEALGPRPTHGRRPAKLQALAEQIAAALGAPTLNPDSQQELLKALRRAGIAARSTRRWELREVEHPVIEPLLRYKELARLHAAHGWAWRDQWVRAGRFHGEYVPGGVVSGRWATRGGGALQIPRVVRGAVMADPGCELIVADAGQLEPRVLAALSRDPGMVAATREGDLYAAIARQALGGEAARADAKLALLSAMYGGGGGSVGLEALRRRFPAALAMLEEAARTGERGGSVRSVLGRTSPAATPGWLDDATDPAARERARGRFTRNFVIQASAADWAGVLLGLLRRRLSALADGRGRPELVFFQHDEVIVHTPAGLADAVVEAVVAAGAEATGLVLGETGVAVPLQATVVRSYADKG
jgi:DNA polymerase-1